MNDQTFMKTIPAPYIATSMAKHWDENNMWDVLEKEGCSGEFETPNGSIVEYSYDPVNKNIQTRLRVNWAIEEIVLAQAKEARDQEKRGMAAHGINGGLCKISPYLDTVLRYKGIDMMTLDNDPDMRNAFLYEIEYNFPKYKTTNRKLI